MIEDIFLIVLRTSDLLKMPSCKATYRVAIAFVALFATIRIAGQHWKSLPQVVTGNNGVTKVSIAPTCGVTYDSVFKEFWAGHASHFIVSKDNGVSWQEPALPSTPSQYNLYMLISAGAGRVIGSWVNSYTKRSFVDYDRSTNRWKMINQTQMFAVQAVIDSVSAIGAIDKVGLESMISHCRDSTWQRLVPTESHSLGENRAGNDPFIQYVHPSTLSLKFEGAWFEYSSKTGQKNISPVPLTATHYSYAAEKDAVIASIRTPISDGTKTIYHLSIGVSADSGQTWKLMDTIHFVNSDEIITDTESNKSILQISGIRLHGSTVTVVLADGRVFSTNDGGDTFWYRGAGEYYPYEDKFGELGKITYPSMASDVEGNLYYVRRGQLFHVPADIRQPLECITKGMQFIGFTVGDGTMLVTGPSYLARSTDAGSTWLLTGTVTEQYEDQDYTPVPQEKMIFDRIVATDTNDIAVLSSTGNIQAQYLGGDGVYRLDGYYRLNWAYQGEVELWIGEFHSDDYVTKNYEVADFTPDSVVDLNWGVIYMKADSAAPLLGDSLPRAYEDKKPRFYQQSNSEVFCQKTVLWRTTDGGATWQEIGKGLPADSNGRQGTIASILRLRDGRLLCGMKGYTLYTQREFSTENYDTSYVGGGLWVSSDNGQNWQELPHPAVAGSNVWFLKRKGDLNEQRLATVVDGGTDTLVASVGTVETKRVLDAYGQTVSVTTMRDARIVTSTDGGVSWKVTYNEPKSRPGFSPRREIISRRDGSLLAATVESGVLWSPNGLVWTPLGNDTLNQTVILDIDVDTNDVVYAATDKGIFYINDRPTSVDDGKLNIPSRNGRFFSMWTYPTPVRTQVQVRLNNVEALGNTIRSLKLYNIYGTEVADYSTAIPQQSAGRAEFTINLPAHIASGVYLLALDTGAGIVSSKLFVAEP